MDRRGPLFPGGTCEAEQVPPLPPEQLPEPEPDTTTGETSAGETGTGETTTGEPSSESTSAASTTANTSSEEPVPTTSDASTLDPTTVDPGASATSEGASESASGGASGGAEETPDKVGCGCNGDASSLWGLAPRPASTLAARMMWTSRCKAVVLSCNAPEQSRLHVGSGPDASIG